MMTAYFTLIFTPIMHVQWEGPNNTVARPVDRLWRLIAKHRATRWPICAQSWKTLPSPILPLKQKWGQCISVGI